MTRNSCGSWCGGVENGQPLQGRQLAEYLIGHYEVIQETES